MAGKQAPPRRPEPDEVQMNNTIGEKLFKLLGGLGARKLRDVLEADNKLLEASKLALAELKQFLDESGGCDYSVGICWCEYIRKLDALNEAINSAEKARNA